MMFLVYLLMLLEPLATLAQSATQFQNSLCGLDRVLDLLAEPREMAAAPDSIKADRRSIAGRRRLRGRQLHLPGRRSAGRSATSTSSRRRADGRPGRPQRRGQDDALQPRRAVLRPDRGAHHARRPRPARYRRRDLPLAAGDRRAGRVPLRRHDRREHRLRAPRRDAGGDSRGRRGGQRRRVHRPAARRHTTP